MNLTVNGESEVTRSAHKITEAIRKQPFPWVPTLICGIIITTIAVLITYYVTERLNRESREEDAGKMIAITVANDLRISIPVAQATRQMIIKKEFVTDSGIFISIYSPLVDLPSVTETAVLHPTVVNALDEYRRRIADFSKHQQAYVDELRQDGDRGTIKRILFVYCVSLDSVVWTGSILLQKLKEHYPTAMQGISEIPPYDPIEKDMPEIQKAMSEQPANIRKKAEQ